MAIQVFSMGDLLPYPVYIGMNTGGKARIYSRNYLSNQEWIWELYAYEEESRNSCNLTENQKKYLGLIWPWKFAQNFPEAISKLYTWCFIETMQYIFCICIKLLNITLPWEYLSLVLLKPLRVLENKKMYLELVLKENTNLVL